MVEAMIPYLVLCALMCVWASVRNRHEARREGALWFLCMVTGVFVWWPVLFVADLWRWARTPK